jgi:hypothetical protein
MPFQLWLNVAIPAMLPRREWAKADLRAVLAILRAIETERGEAILEVVYNRSKEETMSMRVTSGQRVPEAAEMFGEWVWRSRIGLRGKASFRSGTRGSRCPVPTPRLFRRLKRKEGIGSSQGPALGRDRLAEERVSKGKIATRNRAQR